MKAAEKPLVKALQPWFTVYDGQTGDPIGFCRKHVETKQVGRKTLYRKDPEKRVLVWFGGDHRGVILPAEDCNAFFVCERFSLKPKVSDEIETELAWLNRF